MDRLGYGANQVSTQDLIYVWRSFSPRATSVALGFYAVRTSQAVDSSNDYHLWKSGQGPRHCKNFTYRLDNKIRSGTPTAAPRCKLPAYILSQARSGNGHDLF